MPVPGHVAGSVAADVLASRVNDAEVARRGVHCVGVSGPGRKRIRLNRKPQHTLWV